MFDSVLEGSSRFAPELATPDLDEKAHQCDLACVCKSFVYPPVTGTAFPELF